MRISLHLALRRAAAALMCLGLTAALSTADATMVRAGESGSGSPPAAGSGAPGEVPDTNGSEPRDSGDYALPESQRPSGGDLPDKFDRHRDAPSPGCPYEEGPLNLIV